jgi:hypothetical protein
MNERETNMKSDFSVPTVSALNEAEQRMTRIRNELAAAEMTFRRFSCYSPVDVAFSEGRACAAMQTNPDGHWAQFVERFGQVEGARARFDAGRASNEPNLDERKVTMQAIRYLSQIAEKLNLAITAGTIHGREGTQTCAQIWDHIEHICQYDLEDLGLQTRMEGIVKSLAWLAGVRKCFDSVLSAPGESAPSVIEIETLAIHWIDPSAN